MAAQGGAPCRSQHRAQRVTALDVHQLALLPWYGEAARAIRAAFDWLWQRTGEGATSYLVVIDYLTENGGGTGEYEVFANGEEEAEEIGRHLQSQIGRAHV